MDSAALKHLLYGMCSDYIEKGMAAAQQAIADARAAADEDDKSSAGDKYETAREMMQQDIDLHNAHIAELQKLRAALGLVSPAHESDTVQPGSLVRSSQGNYYIAISVGKLSSDGDVWYALSPASPLGARLMGLNAGDSFALNGKQFVLTQVL